MICCCKSPNFGFTLWIQPILLSIIVYTIKLYLMLSYLWWCLYFYIVWMSHSPQSSLLIRIAFINWSLIYCAVFDYNRSNTFFHVIYLNRVQMKLWYFYNITYKKFKCIKCIKMLTLKCPNFCAKSSTCNF